MLERGAFFATLFEDLVSTARTESVRNLVEAIGGAAKTPPQPAVKDKK